MAHRLVTVHDVAARSGVSIATAAADVVMTKLAQQQKHTGGVLARDREGDITAPFNTAGMYRASMNSKGELIVKIYKEE